MGQSLWAEALDYMNTIRSWGIWGPQSVLYDHNVGLEKQLTCSKRNGRTVCSSCLIILKSCSTISSMKTCFFFDSPSLKAVATEEPGCKISKPEADSYKQSKTNQNKSLIMLHNGHSFELWSNSVLEPDMKEMFRALDILYNPQSPSRAAEYSKVFWINTVVNQPLGDSNIEISPDRAWNAEDAQ